MKKKILFLTFLSIFIILFGFKFSYSKDYSIPKVNIEVAINKDGSAFFIEERTYAFDGQFSFGYYNLPKKGFDSLENFLIYEGETLYKKENSKLPKTYYIEDLGSYYKINFFYNASNETKNFKFVYKLNGVTKVYEDYGEFYYKLQGTGWDKTVGIFKANIRFLLPIPIDEYFIWAHGPLWGKIEKVDEKTVYLEVEDVPANTFVEARILIPSYYFSDAEKLSGVIKDKVINEETKWAKSSNLKRVLNNIFFYLPLISFLLLLYYIFYLYFKYGKEHKVPKKYNYIREPPTDIKPAVLGHLLTFGQFKDTFLKVTIMDLIGRGVINVEKDKNKKNNYIFTLNKNKEELDNYEKILVEEILFDKNDSFTTKELNKKIKKRREHYYYKFEDLKKAIVDEAENYDFFDKVSEGKSNLVIRLGGLIPVIALILTSILKNLLFLLWFLLAPIYIFVGSISLKRRSFKGKEEFDKWIAFKNFLNDFSNLKDYGPKSIVIWEKYLIYGTILGVAKTVLKALKVILPQISDVENSRLIPIVTGDSIKNFDKGFVFLNSALSKAVSGMSSAYKSSRSSLSSGSGSGGGFSSGGGGGGGGSGGGMG